MVLRKARNFWGKAFLPEFPAMPCHCPVLAGAAFGETQFLEIGNSVTTELDISLIDRGFFRGLVPPVIKLRKTKKLQIRASNGVHRGVSSHSSVPRPWQ